MAFVTRLLFLLFYKFDGFYGQDSFAYYDWSVSFYNAITHFQIPPFYYWPIGFFLFTSLFSLLTAGNIELASLLVSLNAGTLVCSVTYLIASEFFKGSDKKRQSFISYFSAFIVCFVTINLKASVVVMSDTLGLLLASLSVLFVL